MLLELREKNILITGGANGIGHELSKLLCNSNNVIVIDIDEETVNKRIIELPNVKYYVGDIKDESAIGTITCDIKNKYNKIDLLINNAAKQTVCEFENLSVNEWKEVIDTNLTGTFIVTKYIQEIIPDFGTIFNVLSVHHDKPRLNKFHYDASKAGVAMLTKELALALAKRNITVNGISFGAVSTNMNAEWLGNDEKVNETLNKIPLRRIFSAEEIANYIINIIVNFSHNTTGSIFTVDGGRSLT